MRKGIILAVLFLLMVQPVSAMEFTAPTITGEAEAFMPANTESFAEGLWFVIKTATAKLQPSIAEAAEICIGLIAIVLLVSLLHNFSGAPLRVVSLVGTLGIAAQLIKPSNTLIHLGIQTVEEISEYGKLFLPVMTAAMAAQGGVTAATALYTGTAFFNALLTSGVSKVIVPMLCVYLCLSVANNTIREEVLKNLRNFIKWLMTWSLKIVLYIFSGYMGITGVVSGTADAAAIKAAKITISGAVPVVGGILSDASEAILVSAGIMKNAAGVYGLLAILAICIGPFFRIGVQYLLLKITSAVCSVFGVKQAVDMINDFSEVMGFLLAMTGTVCLLLLISTVCFMKGVN